MFVDPQIPRLLIGDANRLRQILTNLVNNAIKFSSKSPQDGQVYARTELLKREEERVWIRFLVQDNGIGISESAQTRLFQKFEQADSSTTRTYGGSGLGLVICRHLIEMMGGDISLQSTVGKGSEFTVTLPFAVPPEQPTLELSVIKGLPYQESGFNLEILGITREQALQQGRLILVSEDNRVNQKVIFEQLKLLNFYVDITHDGCEALARWLVEDYALVLSDIHMPNMDGYELTRAIRSEETKTGAGHTPIIALTAIALTGEAEKCKAVGMDDYLTKPAPLSELKAMMEKWMPKRHIENQGEMSSLAILPKVLITESDNSQHTGEEHKDWDVNVLSTIIGSDPVNQRKFLEMFLINMEKQQTMLQAAVLAGDLAAIRSAAHGFKSASRYVGAVRLGELCQELESAGKNGDLTVCQSLSVEFSKACEIAGRLIKESLE